MPWKTEADGARTWNEDVAEPSLKAPKKPRKPRPRTAGGVDRWARDSWRYSEPDANGVRTRIALSPQEKAERQAARAKAAERKEALDLLIRDLVADTMPREGDPAFFPERLMPSDQPEPRVLLELPREDSKLLRVYARTWTVKSTGEMVDYVNVHSARIVGGRLIRTYGVAIRASELRAVAAVLVAEADRLGV